MGRSEPRRCRRLLPCHYTMKERWRRLFFPKLCVRIKATITRHMVSFMDFYFHFLANFQTYTFSIFTHVMKPVKALGYGKRGHIVANTNVSQFSRAQHLLWTQILCLGHKNFSDFVQKHFVSAKNVSQFAHPKKHHGQQCVRNNVSLFARTFSDTHREPGLPIISVFRAFLQKESFSS